MDGFYDKQYNMNSYDQSSNIEPGATFGEYISTNANIGMQDNQPSENFGELGYLDSYKNNSVIKLSPVTIGAYPTSSSFSKYELNENEAISSTSNYDTYTNANTFQDTYINANLYDNNGNYTNMEPILSSLPQAYDGYDSTTSNNIDYQMDSNIIGNDFPIVSNNNIILSDNLQSAGSDRQYNELFKSQELVSSQNEEKDPYLSDYRNDTVNENYDEGQYVNTYQHDDNSMNWSYIPSSNNNTYESQNLNVDSNEQIQLYKL